MLDFVEGVWLVLMVPWVGEWVVTRQLSTSIFGRSSIIDETPTAFMPSMPCSRRTAMYDKLRVAISNLQSPCSLLILLVTSGSLSLCRNEATTPTCAGDSRLGLHSSCFVASSASRRPLQGCAHLRPQPSACFQHLRAFRLTRTALFCRLSPRYVAVTAHPRRHVSGGACVCEWLKMLGLVRSVW
jgi:hypothetical protein